MKININLKIELSSKMGYPTKKEVIEWLEYVCGQETQISAGNPLVEFELSAGGMVSVCLADFFNLPQTLMANCTIPLVVCLVRAN